MNYVINIDFVFDLSFFQEKLLSELQLCLFSDKKISLRKYLNKSLSSSKSFRQDLQQIHLIPQSP